MDDPRHCTGVARATDRDLDLGAWSAHAVESPERRGGHVGRYGAVPGGQDGAQDALLARRRVGGVAHDTAPDGYQHAL
jgi:hypothetical protein